MVRIVRLSDKVSARIEGEDPLDNLDLTDLAASLAQHLQAASNYREDARVFAERANVEKRKAAEMRALIEEVRARRDNPPAKKSRMDPLDSYDEHALAAQAGQHDRNADKFTRDSSEYTAKAEREQRLSDETQRLISQVQKRQKQR
jgi:hypothetical protein